MPESHSTRFTIKDILSRHYRPSLIGAGLLLAFAYLVEHYANLYELEYSARPTSTYVGDILLDNLPVLHLNFIIIEGAFLGLVLGAIYLLHRPRYILFTLKAFALLIATRAFFISLTHVGIYPGVSYPEAGIFDGLYSYLNLQTGFFFSGHTSVPFLMALIFWKDKRERIVFLSISLIFAIAVLLAHVHYSIDVFAAPFMTYGIFVIAKNLFKKDFELILEKNRLETHPI